MYHPTNEKLLGIIKRGAEANITPELPNQLGNIRTTCDTFQRLSKEPLRFHVSMPSEDCVFNLTVGMDVMKLEKISVHQIVDHGTKFSAAVFLNGE